MCGRFVQYSHPEVYAAQYDLDVLCEVRPRYNLAPTQPVLVIRRTERGQRELVPMRWGLIPAWSKGPDHRYSMINARSESVLTKPAYRAAFKHRRCLIPSEGFYEWKSDAGVKVPYLIRRKDGLPFVMAGLWERWLGREGQALESCTIIVTDANALVSAIHDRMPVILAPADCSAWLDPDNPNLDGLQALLRPSDPQPWTLHPVSRRVNNPRNDTPDLLEPVPASPGANGGTGDAFAPHQPSG